jgi:uncharacterized protein (DUF2252 family)
VALLVDQSTDRLEHLAPVRHGRMAASPFTFFRGAAAIMANDLARTPSTGLTVQAAGDAHLSNFGAYASPERALVFDQNDFDETLPGPWEWDVKRLATSLVIAGDDRGFGASTARTVARAAVVAYQEAMARFAEMRVLDLWYDRLDAAAVTATVDAATTGNAERVARFEARARNRNSLQALRKLTIEVGGRRQIRHDPPILLRLRDVPELASADLERAAFEVLDHYATSLPDDKRHLYEHFRPIDIALKVVGVGSVGTRCLIVLFEGRDRDDPLFLQVKEAGASVLEAHLPASPYHHHGRRVVEGQRLIQAASDIFLGWTTGPAGRHFYVRQLRDWKGSVDVSRMDPDRLTTYGRLCGATLARGHARTGDPVAIAAYLGTGSSFPRAVARFAEAYAELNRLDYEAFLAAIEDGHLESTPGV